MYHPEVVGKIVQFVLEELYQNGIPSEKIELATINSGSLYIEFNNRTIIVDLKVH